MDGTTPTASTEFLGIRLADLRCRMSGTGGAVEVEIDGTGQVLELVLAPPPTMSMQDLADEVKDTLARAQQQLAAEVAELADLAAATADPTLQQTMARAEQRMDELTEMAAASLARLRGRY